MKTEVRSCDFMVLDLQVRWEYEEVKNGTSWRKSQVTRIYSIPGLFLLHDVLNCYPNICCQMCVIPDSHRN
jgi:hypothetical protein